MSDFEPKGVDRPYGDIIPRSSPKPDIETAQQECDSVVSQLTTDISGIGPKAAERYLLRFEYGFKPKTLTEEFDITAPTISKQTVSVREKILKYPALARIVGQWRAERANLSEPDTADGVLWEGEIDIQPSPVRSTIEYYSGSASSSDSWRYSLTAKSDVGDWIRHLRVNYLIDDEYGVMLKRTLKSVSHVSWRREPFTEPKRFYTVYPLPHIEVPNEGGSLSRAVEYHSVYDIISSFQIEDWNQLEIRAERRSSSETRSAEHGLREILVERIRQGDSKSPVENYTQERYIRENTEHLLRVYPLSDISQIPLETVDLLWNGHFNRLLGDSTSLDNLDYLFETSVIDRRPGDR